MWKNLQLQVLNFQSMNKKQQEIVKIITELADLYGIEYELKIKINNMEDKTKRIAELFKQEMERVQNSKK